MSLKRALTESLFIILITIWIFIGAYLMAREDVAITVLVIGLAAWFIYVLWRIVREG